MKQAGSGWLEGDLKGSSISEAPASRASEAAALSVPELAGVAAAASASLP
jgi:hypothetical protein